MTASTQPASALDVSGDARIARELARTGTVVIPAHACRLDGFVNDTFTEYAHSSVYRPASVCRAALVSVLQDTVREAGRYYLGFTLYAVAGGDEPVEMWIGHRLVAMARARVGDNRLHLLVVPEPFRFRGGEPIRLVTGATHGPHRIENVVLLRRRPRVPRSALAILHPHVDLARQGDEVQARITWITSRPSRGDLYWRRGREQTTKHLGHLLV